MYVTPTACSEKKVHIQQYTQNDEINGLKQ